MFVLALGILAVGCVDNRGSCKEVEISIEPGELNYSQEKQAYISETQIIEIKGSIKNSEEISKLDYALKDEVGSVKASGNLSISSFFNIEGLKLFEGINKLEVKATLINGSIVTKDIRIYYEDPVKIIINRDDFKLIDEEKLLYSFIDEGEGIRGKVEGDLSKLASMKLIVKDDRGHIIKMSDIKKNAEWNAFDYGFMMGVNKLIIEGELSDGTKITDSLMVGAGNSMMYNLDLDKGDNDGDGLINYLEDYYGINKDMADTDGDGLNDFLELEYINTDPLSKDSNNDGILDGEDDYDRDGLSNGYEAAHNLSVIFYDTDYDDLSDYEELNLYYTDPLKKDTDGDGAFDNWELDNGFDPLIYNSSFSLTIEKTGVDDISKVELNISGMAGADTVSCKIEEVSSNLFIHEGILGYIGSTYDFTADSFTSGEVSFTLDSSLFDDDAFIPGVYYFNEETQILEEQLIRG